VQQLVRVMYLAVGARLRASVGPAPPPLAAVDTGCSACTSSRHAAGRRTHLCIIYTDCM
jgi:hypothetical protein